MALPAAPDREQRDDAVTPAGSDAPDAGPDERPARISAGVRWVVLGILVLVILGSLGYLGARVVDDGSGSGWDRVSSAFSGDDPLQGDRDAVMSQARQFVLRVNTYGPDLLDAKSGQMPKYRQLVEDVVSAKFRTDFEKNGVPLAEASVSQTGLKRTAQVYSTGVAVIDDDTATALVAGSFTNAYPKTAGSQDYTPADPQPFRFEVSLVRTDGKWLVDDFAPVESASAGASPGASGVTGQGSTGGAGQ